MLQTFVVESKNSGSIKLCVIFLHGLGSNGYDFANILTSLQLSNSPEVKFIFPHAPLSVIKWISNQKIRSWFDIIDKDTMLEDNISIKKSQYLLFKLIDNEINKVEKQKIILVGFSQGGAMALHCGLRYEKEIIKILTFSSWLPLNNNLLIERSLINYNTKILMMHGTNDEIVPLNIAKNSYQYLYKIGYNIKFLTYPIGHWCCVEGFKILDFWIKNSLTQ